MLKDKSALITGSTSGIGLGIARALAREGANITLNGLGDAAEIERIRASLAAETGVQVRYDGADLRQPDQIRRMVAGVEAAFGRIDILVNNAGVQFVAPIESFPEEKWDLVIAVNLSAAFHATKAVVPGMRARKTGRIVNISSGHGLVASPFKSAYVAAKHGLVGLTKVVALEVARDGITCNAICPGYVRTPLVEAQIEAQVRATGLPREKVIADNFLAKHAIKRFVEIDQVAAGVLFLCAEDSGSVTGSALSIDAGFTAG
jgi:3-hydroxybutyrate dehydrogenase